MRSQIILYILPYVTENDIITHDTLNYNIIYLLIKHSLYNGKSLYLRISFIFYVIFHNIRKKIQVDMGWHIFSSLNKTLYGL